MDPQPLKIRFSSRAPFTTARELEEALSLIRRLVAAPGVGIVKLRPSAITLEALTGGRSAAHVFKLTPLLGSSGKTKGTPVVVKIAPRAQGAAEKANYQRYVRPGLPAASRPALLGFAATRGRAALCYSFVGGRDGARPETLTDHLRRGETRTLDLVLRRLVAPLRDTWHGAAQIRRQRDIARAYRERFFTGRRAIARDEAALGACAARYFGAQRQGGGYRIGAAWFPPPGAVLSESARKRPYHSCILHGDLNTDNILVAPGRAPERAGVTLIDFLKTGRGPVFQDFAFLEQSVRINHPADASFGELVEIERLIALGLRPPVATPYASAIRKIRAAAVRAFGAIEDQANYHLAVAALGLRLMQATDLSDVARARIAVSALWAAKMLAEEGAT